MKPKQTNFTGIDLGSSKIAVLAANIHNNGDTRVGYQGLYHSDGIRAGVIKDFQQAENSIVNAIYQLEQESGRNIKSVSLTLSGAEAKSYYVYEKLPISTNPVTKTHLDELTDRAISKFKVDNKTVLHFFPIEYTIHNDSIQDPVGMFADVLGCRLHIIAVNNTYLSNIVNCFANCHIQVKDVLLNTYACGLACLTEDEKSLGSMIIDFGSRATSFGIFLGGNIVYTGYVPFGSFHITSDIAQIFSLSLSAAEKVKILYGSAVMNSTDSKNVVNLSEVEPNGTFDTEATITFGDIAQVIIARTEEIVELVKKEYDKVGLDHLVSRRIVLTGGGAQMRGLKEIVAAMFKKQARLAQSQSVFGFIAEHNYQSYASAIGLLKYEIIQRSKIRYQKYNPDNVVNKIMNWLKS